MKVAVLGASNKHDRYSYKALMLLKQYGHTPFPVNPALREIEGIPVFPSLEALPEPPDVVTVYLSDANQDKIADAVLKSGARRIIFNPGAENPALAEKLGAAGVETLNACTLVLLKTGQFDF